jgi:hypothetical protein
VTSGDVTVFVSIFLAALVLCGGFLDLMIVVVSHTPVL